MLNVIRQINYYCFHTKLFPQEIISKWYSNVIEQILLIGFEWTSIMYIVHTLTDRLVDQTETIWPRFILSNQSQSDIGLYRELGHEYYWSVSRTGSWILLVCIQNWVMNIIGANKLNKKDTRWPQSRLLPQLVPEQIENVYPEQPPTNERKENIQNKTYQNGWIK